MRKKLFCAKKVTTLPDLTVLVLVTTSVNDLDPRTIYSYSFRIYFACTLFNNASSAAPSDSTVSEDAGIKPRTVATFQHWQSDALSTWLGLIPRVGPLLGVLLSYDMFFLNKFLRS
jgi:hypothetical protein